MIRPNDLKITLEYNDDVWIYEGDGGRTTYAFIEEVVAPLMIAMGYFPTNVYEALNLTDTLDVIKSAVKEGRV